MNKTINSFVSPESLDLKMKDISSVFDRQLERLKTSPELCSMPIFRGLGDLFYPTEPESFTGNNDFLNADLETKMKEEEGDRPVLMESPNRRDKLVKRKPEFTRTEHYQDKRVKTEVETDSVCKTKNNKEISSDTSTGNLKQDFIHVRARRGQATDSHSLAERARREKISKKMKCLQDLVPGCNKITGKAGMLDEIINYVQSLQRQVEFLSMKLAAVTPRLEFDIDMHCLQSNSMQQIAADPMFHMQTQGNAFSSVSNPELYLGSSCISQVAELQSLYDAYNAILN